MESNQRAAVGLTGTIFKYLLLLALCSCANEQLPIVNGYRLIDNDGGNFGILGDEGRVYVHGVTAYSVSEGRIFIESRVFDLPAGQKRCDYKIVDTIDNRIVSAAPGTLDHNDIVERIRSEGKVLTSASCAEPSG